MKKIASRLLIMASVLLILSACNTASGPESRSNTTLNISTDLPAPTDAPLEAPTPTDLPTIAPSLVPTDTPYPAPLATQAGCNFGNNISVPIPSNSPCFTVTRNSKVLTISSTDGKSHTCTFTGTPSVTVKVEQGKTSSDPFQLGDGEYTLTCVGSPTSVKIK